MPFAKCLLAEALVETKILGEGPLIGKAWNLTSNVSNTLRVDFSNRIAITLGQFGNHLTPWVDDYGVSVRGTICAVSAVLGWRDYIALAFDSPCPQQCVPMGGASGCGKGRGPKITDPINGLSLQKAKDICIGSILYLLAKLQ